MNFWIFIYVKLGQGKKSMGNATYAFRVSKDMTTASQTIDRAVEQRYLQTCRKLGAGLEGKKYSLTQKVGNRSEKQRKRDWGRINI